MLNRYHTILAELTRLFSALVLNKLLTVINYPPVWLVTLHNFSCHRSVIGASLSKPHTSELAV